jgi:hypothetical protein
MDRAPPIRDSANAMWIRPHRSPLARMPSLRPQPSAPAAVPGKRNAPAAPAPAPAEAPLTEEEVRARGGFHESSYELRNGMDMMETEWPDDTTIPGALDEL